VEHIAGPGELRRLLDGVLTIGSDLDLHSVLRRIIATASDLVSARYGALGVLDPTGTRLVDFVTHGVDDSVRAAIGRLPEGRGVLGLLIIDPRPLRIADLREHPDRFGFPPGHPPMTSFLGVPIVMRGRVFGNLYFCDKVGGGSFSDVDEELAVGLATAAGVAVENARLHARVAELATIEDRERIARELHDTVIQRLFAIGLSLQASLRTVTEPKMMERLTTAIDDLDQTVRDVRSAIFELQPTRLPGRSLRQELVHLGAESARALGFEPVLRFDGPIDAAVDDALATEVLTVVREALSNVSKHAHAKSAEVHVEAREGFVTVAVIDDGGGYQPETTVGRGIANLKSRAQERGGTMAIESNSGTGTIVSWRVPLPAPADSTQ
jgi:signal transduction histidine kinase